MQDFTRHVCFTWVEDLGTSDPGVVIAPFHHTLFGCLSAIAEVLEVEEEELRWEPEWWPLGLCPVQPREGKHPCPWVQDFKPVYHQDRLVAVLVRRK